MSTTRVPCVFDLMPASQRTIDENGFLHAPATLSRVGVQKYRAREVCGVDGQPIFNEVSPDDFISLLRPEEEISDPASVASFENLPITDGHPDPARYPDGVTPENWKELSIGHVRDTKWGAADKKVHGTTHVMDAQGISKLYSGKSQLSLGYGFECEKCSGRTDDGQEYHGIMRKVRGNHLATVFVARGGPDCRVADHQTSEENMATVKITVDGFEHELPEGNTASLVKTLLVQRDEARAGLKEKMDAHGTAVAKLTADHAAEITKLKAESLPRAEVPALVVEHSELLKVAGSLCDGLTTDKLDTPSLRRAMVGHLCEKRPPVKSVVEAVLAGTALDKASDDQIRVACNTAIASARSHVADEADRRDQIAHAFSRSGDDKTAQASSSEEIPDFSDEAYRRKMSNKGQRTAGK